MIHMLSRFDLREGVTPTAFIAHYARLTETMVARDLLIRSTPPGRRVADTPMDTDAAAGPGFFSVMSFRDRAQLDNAYAFLSGPPQTGAEHEAHSFIKRASLAPVFTCWQDET